METFIKIVRILLLSWIVSLAAAPLAFAQDGPASVHLTARDVTGAVVVGATVEVTSEAGSAFDAVTDNRGTATIRNLTAGSWALRVSSPGFEDYVVEGVSLESGDNRFDITLRIAGLTQAITVTRDPREAAIDPKGDTMTLVFDEEQLDTLPDTEDDMQQLLMEMAGPDAEITVDGFLGGSLPPKSQIQQIRIQRAIYSADRHWGGRSRIEIITRPGSDDWRGRVTFGFRDEALDARNAFAPEEMPEQTRRGSISLRGPLVRNRTSLSLHVEGLSAYQSNTIRAIAPSGAISDLVRQPEDRLEGSIGVQHALTPLHSLRLEYRDERRNADNLGVGDFNLLDRAYSRTVHEKRLRLSSIGTFGARLLNETRLQASWADVDSTPQSTDPTIRVLDSVTFGGANLRGGRAERSVSLDEKLEVHLGAHNVVTGGRLDWSRFDSTEMTNPNGTFTFSSLGDLEAARPDSYSVRQGDPRVRYSMFRGGLFVQDDVHLGKSLMVGAGVRQEWQSHVNDRFNLAPRAGFSWAPFKNGRTTVRGGAGLFNEWYDSSAYEETLQVNGTRVQDITIRSPGYPDPLTGGDIVVLPNGRVRQSPDLELPLRRQATVAVEHRFGEHVRLDVGYSLRDEIRQLRGRNVNAPGPDGIRPDPTAGNIIEIQSIGLGREDQVTTGGTLRVPSRHLFVGLRYTYENERNDGDGALSLPANNAAPDEWGPSGDDVRHRFSIYTSFSPYDPVRIGMHLRAESAPPYTITTGHDDNGDTVFNDRPAGVPRHSERGDGLVRLDLRLAWRLGLGPPRLPGDPAAMPPQGGRGRRSEWRERHSVMTELYVRVSNVLNAVSLARFSGVLTSPFFGEPTAARAPRRVEIGSRFMF